MIPTKTPDGLSPATRDRYLRALRDESTSIQFKSDDPITKAIALELAEAGLATVTLSTEYTCYAHLVRPAKGFSVARMEEASDYPGYLYAEVEILRESTDRTGHLLACLSGARFQNKTPTGAPWQKWNLSVRHHSAVDSDHDACILATLDIEHPVMDSHDGISTEFVGTLSKINMWPTGTDITLLDSHDGTPIEEPEICDYGSCAKNPHPYGPYLPKKRADLNAYLGSLVRVTTTPLALVHDNGLHVARNVVTSDDA